MLTHIKTPIALLAACFVFASPQANAGAVAPIIAGSWQITGTPAPNACGITAPFTNFAVIAADGTLVNTDPTVGTAVGEVFRIGRRTYGVGFFGFIAPAPGVVLKYEVQATLEASWGGTASGRFRTIVSDTNGVIPSCTYEGVIEGQKLSPMPY